MRRWIIGPGERGGVLIELSIVSPLLLILCLSLYDLGNLLHVHREISSITREALRVASGVPLLEEGDFEMEIATETGRPRFTYDIFNGPSGTCDQDVSRNWPSCGNGEKQRNAISNGFSLLIAETEFDAALIDGYSPKMSVRFRGSKINLQTSVQYRGFTGIFSNLTVGAKATGPYL